MKKLITICLILFVNSIINGQELAKEFNPNINNGIAGGGAYIIGYNGNLLLTAQTNTTNGYELVQYDPVSSVVTSLPDIAAGSRNSFPKHMVSFNGAVYFAANAEEGLTSSSGFTLFQRTKGEMYFYDGTSITKKNSAGFSSSGSIDTDPKELIIYNNKIFFTANQEDDNRRLLARWGGNGTGNYSEAIVDGTYQQPVGGGFPSENDPNPLFLEVANNKLYFSAKVTSTTRGLFYFQDNGASPATSGRIGTYENPMYIKVNGTDLFFLSSGMYYKYDTTNPSAAAIATNAPLPSSKPVSHGGKLYYRSEYSSPFNSFDLVEYNITANTSSRISINSTTDSNVKSIEKFGGKIFFSAVDDNSGAELHKYDPSTETYTIVSDINPGSNDSAPNDLYVFDNKLYFSAVGNGIGRELWRLNNSNLAPKIKTPIPDQVYSSPPSGSSTINLSTYFEDFETNSNSLTYLVTSTDPSFFSTNISNSTLTISYNTISGTDSITIQAQDSSGNSVSDTFSVQINACDTPSNVSISNIGVTTATISWDNVVTAQDGYRWYVMASGSVPPVVSIATNVTTSGTNSVNVTGLSENTNYDIYVKSRCSSTTESSLSTVASFSTIINTTTFTGAVNNSFSTSGNWSNGLPFSGKDAIIPTGKTAELQGGISFRNLEIQNGASLTVTSASLIVEDVLNNGNINVNNRAVLNINGNITNSGNITLESDALGSSSIIVDGVYSGNSLTYKRYVSDKWHLISTPVNGMSLNNIIANTPLAIGTIDNNHVGFAEYNNNLPNGWNYYTNSTTGNSTAMMGYAIKRDGAGIVDINGTFRQASSLAISLSRGTQSDWNLIGNPYASFLAANTNASTISNLLTENSSDLDPNFQALYFWDPTANSDNGDYIIVNQMSSAQYIAPGQGFFVQIKSGGGNFTFKKDMQSHTTGNTFYRNNNSLPSIGLKLALGNSNNKLTNIKYLSSSTRGLDPGYDAGQFNGIETGFNIYTQLVDNNQGINFGLQVLPDDYENIVIPIGVNAEAKSEIIFTVNHNNLPSDLKVFLEDKELNTITRLDIPNSEYRPTPGSNINGVGRFYLHTSTQSVLNTNEVALPEVSIYTQERNLVITNIHGKTTIKVVDILGKEVLTRTKQSKGELELALVSSIKPGVYIIKVNTEKGSKTKKVVIK
jgi:ELWxxDGT repeat protein